MENLAKRHDQAFNLFVTSRKQASANTAAQKLRETISNTGTTITALELDLANKAQIDTLIADLVAKGIKFDVLVNNAALCTFEEAKKSNEGFFREWNVNYVHTRYLTEQFIQKEILNNSGKVINTSSGIGNAYYIKEINPEFFKIIVSGRDLNINLEQVTEYANVCQEDYQSEEKKKNWHPWVYASTKLFLNLFTIALSKDPKVVEKGIQVYGLCPGFCKTNMTTARFGDAPPKTSDEGAQTSLYLIDLPFEIDQDLQGGFFEDAKKSSYNYEVGSGPEIITDD